MPISMKTVRGFCGNCSPRRGISSSMIIKAPTIMKALARETSLHTSQCSPRQQIVNRHDSRIDQSQNNAHHIGAAGCRQVRHGQCYADQCERQGQPRFWLDRITQKPGKERNHRRIGKEEHNVRAAGQALQRKERRQNSRRNDDADDHHFGHGHTISGRLSSRTTWKQDQRPQSWGPPG